MSDIEEGNSGGSRSNAEGVENEVNNQAPLSFVQEVESSKPEPTKDFHQFFDTNVYHVSIGPYFLGKVFCKESVKFRCLKYITSTIPQPHHASSLEQCLLSLKNQGYQFNTPDGNDIDSDEVCKMLFLDGCFIITFLSSFGGVTSDRRPMMPYEEFHELYTIEEQPILMDLLKNKNQIPFSVIEHIWNWLKEKNCIESSSDFISLFISKYFDKPTKFETYKPTCPIKNLSHLYHRVMVAPYSPSSYDHVWIPSATQLETTGIKFIWQSDMSSFIDITYSYGTIKIPHIDFDHKRDVLVALLHIEESEDEDSYCATDYCQFMSCLLRNVDDVELLTSKGIINIGDWEKESIVDFFDIVQKRRKHKRPNYLSMVYKKVNKFHQSNRAKWTVDFFRKYCSDPWVLLSLIGVIIVLLLTALQTALALLSYYKPPPN